MAFNWAGAGAGAQDALMEAVKQSLMQRQMGLNEQREQSQMGLDQARLTAFQDDRAAAQREAEAKDAQVSEWRRIAAMELPPDAPPQALFLRDQARAKLAGLSASPELAKPVKPERDPHLYSPEADKQRKDFEAFKAGLKPTKVAGSGSSAPKPAGEMSALAKMVQGNPELLKDLTPTVRSQVMSELAAGGGSLPNKDAEQSFSIAQQGLDTIRTLKNTPWQSAVGAGWNTIGMDPPAGTAAAGALPLIDQLVALMALPEVKVLKGMGHMSDMEFGVIKQAATRLNRKTPDADFARELDNLENVLTQVLERRGAAAAPGVASGRIKPLPTHSAQPQAPASGPAVGERRVINGQVGVWDGRGWAPEGGR